MPHLALLAQGSTGGAPVPWYANPMLLFAAIAAIWWFLLIRPQRLQDRRHKAMLEALKAGDKVYTQSGLLGVVVQVGDKTCRLKIADNVKVEMLRSAIAGLQSAEAEAPAAKKES
jgi:preprotein translocase subunit YajC